MTAAALLKTEQMTKRFGGLIAVDKLDAAAQRKADDAAYRQQIAGLFERSPFYRAKFVAAGVRSAAAAGGEGIASGSPPACGASGAGAAGASSALRPNRREKNPGLSGFVSAMSVASPYECCA